MTHEALPEVPLSGSQLAILILATMLLGTAAGSALVRALGLPQEARFPVDSVMTFSAGAVALLAIAPLRRRASALLRVPVPAGRRIEVALAIIVAALGQFALFGLNAALKWMAGGDAAVIAMQLGPATSIETAFDVATLRNLAITCLAAPLLEEIFYRGFLFEAWARTRAVATAIILSAAVFALVHPVKIHAFFAGLLLCALYVRTGALRASILVHFCANALNWYPLLGQFVIPSDNQGIRSWTFDLVCLATAPLFVAGYAWLAAHSRRPAFDEETSPAAA